MVHHPVNYHVQKVPQKLPGLTEQLDDTIGKNEQFDLLQETVHSVAKPQSQLSESVAELNVAEQKIKDSYEALNEQKSIRPNPSHKVVSKLHTPKGKKISNTHTKKHRFMIGT